MRTRSRLLAVAVIPCSLVLANHYSWTGRATDDNWENCSNWLETCAPPCPPVLDCYPDNPTDTAVIGYRSGGWGTIILNTSPVMGALTIKGAFTLVGNPIPQRLIAESVDFDAVSIPSGGYLTVQVGADAAIWSVLE